MEQATGLDCPVCGKDTGIKADVRLLSDTFVCPHCGSKLEFEHDYSGDDYDLSMWLVAVK
jgi:rubredoxin